MEERIESLLKQMTLEEKTSLLAGADLWRTVPIPRLGIPFLKTSDGPFGARGDDEPSGPTSACLPGGVALAATWDPALVERIGQALAAEVKSKGAHILLAPTVNIHRVPIAGRNFECFSEDPYLTARIAIAYIHGLQKEGVGACIKHLACNDQEFERKSISAEVAERPLREIYLRPFELAIREARPWAVMSAYNRLNGTYCCENDYLLKDILKDEWGYDGLVMSDWTGTYDERVPAGWLDLEMPGPKRWMALALPQVNNGKVSEAHIDDKVRRILRTLERAGVFENPEPQAERALDDPEQRALARQVGSEAVVLLKNEQGILPLKAEGLTEVAVIGENAKWPALSGGGSARLTPHHVVSPLQAIQERLGADRVKWAIGCPVRKQLPAFDGDWYTEPLRAEYFGNRELSSEPIHRETTRKSELVWFGEKLAGDIPYNDYSVRLSGAFRVPETDRYLFSLAGLGRSRLLIDGETIIDNWPSDAVSPREGRAEIELEGNRYYAIVVEFAVLPGPLWRNLRLGCMPALPPDPIAEAVELAKGADVAIVFAGLTPDRESEGFDRDDMELPGDQAALIERVAAANPNTIVVLNSGGPVSMPWLGKVKGVLEAWYLGQETGNAIADVVFGDVNPSGKLPTTFPVRLKDTPGYINYPGENGKVHYGEGLYVGYRYYDKKDVAPLFPFGYGLSYTAFEYRNLVVHQHETLARRLSGGQRTPGRAAGLLTGHRQGNEALEYASIPHSRHDDALAIVPGEITRVSVEVQNIGERAGAEVVQLYLHDVESRLDRPEQELKAFSKVRLEPGEYKRVELALDREAFSYYDPLRGGWVAEAGEFEVRVGASSRDIRLRGSFNWNPPGASSGAAPLRLDVATPLGTLLQNAGSRAVLEKYLGRQIDAEEVREISSFSLEQLAAHAPDLLTREILQAVDDDLSRVALD